MPPIDLIILPPWPSKTPKIETKGIMLIYHIKVSYMCFRQPCIPAHPAINLLFYLF